MQNKHICPSFFNAMTFDPTGSYSPCTALGGSLDKFPNQPINEVWQSNKLEEYRRRSASEKMESCRRCWNEEDVGFNSERQRHLAKVNDGTDFTNKNYYWAGPRSINIKVSNICNLRCRTCQSTDSYIYHIEGEYYEKKNNIANTPYTVEKIKKKFTDQQIDDIYSISGNLEYIGLFGGEPMLDDQVPKLLLRLVDSGRAKDITLNMSTNATHEITADWEKIFKSFKTTIITPSIDGIGKRFTYMRHPGNWNFVHENLQRFISLSRNHPSICIVPTLTLSALNAWHSYEVFDYFKQWNVPVFTILVQTPSYYCINVFPDNIKTIVEEKLMSGPYATELTPLVNLMKTTPKSSHIQPNLSPWEEFKFWTKEKDAYRVENYISTFDDFGEILVKNGAWN